MDQQRDVPVGRPISKRLGLYLLGVSIGLIVLAFFLAARHRAAQGSAEGAEASRSAVTAPNPETPPAGNPSP